MKVSEITYESNTSEFLSIPDIETYVTNLSSFSNEIETGIVEVLDREITNGGLDVYSFNIDGESPAHDIAVELVNSLHKVADDLNEASKDINKKAKQHRRDELTTLKKKVTLKLERIEKDIKMKERLIKSNVSMIQTDREKMSTYESESANGSPTTYTSEQYSAFGNDIYERDNENISLNNDILDLDGIRKTLERKLEEVNAALKEK